MSFNLALAEPACPVCYEPYMTEAPEEDGDLDTRPVLLPGGGSKCLRCCHEVRPVRELYIVLECRS